MWIDANRCEQSFHQLTRVEGKVLCTHSDDSECLDSEYNVSMDEESEEEKQMARAEMYLERI